MDPSSHNLPATPETSESQRLRALESYGILDIEPTDAYDRMVKLASRRLGARAAFIALVDRDRILLVARHGVDLDHLPRTRGRDTPWLATLPQWHDDLDGVTDPALTDFAQLAGFRFLAAAPLVTYNGHILGMLCVADPRPRPKDPALAHELEELAGSLMKKIETRRLYHRLERNQSIFEPRRHHRSRCSQPVARQPSLDRLTALPDRHTLLRRLGRRLEHLRHRPNHLRRPAALLVFDLDDFHQLNAMHGYAAGDRVLAEITRRLESLRGRRDTVARLAGDCFGWLLGDLVTRDQLPSKVAKLRQRLAAPIPLGEGQVRPSFSLGVTWLDPHHHPFADDVLAATEGALRQARPQGSGVAVQAGDPSDRSTLPVEATAAPAAASRPSSDALRTLANDELSLRYRPILDTPRGRPSGFEAHLRWFPRRSITDDGTPSDSRTH